jgi:hypothetical protein
MALPKKGQPKKKQPQFIQEVVEPVIEETPAVEETFLQEIKEPVHEEQEVLVEAPKQPAARRRRRKS